MQQNITMNTRNKPREGRGRGANAGSNSKGERYTETKPQDPATSQSGETIGFVLGLILVLLVAIGALSFKSPFKIEGLKIKKRAISQPAKPSANPVSWQTVFWGLTAIALNTMCQPSGEVLGLPVQYNFVLRISPFVCLVNSLDLIMLYVHFCLKTKGLITAARSLVSYRVKGTEDWNENSFAALRNNTYFRVLLFVLGALPQITKICAFKGVPMSQFYMACFLSSFVLDEFVLFVGRGEEPRRPARRRDTGDEGLSGIARGFQTAVRNLSIGISVFITLSNNSASLLELCYFYSSDKTWPFAVFIGISGAAYLFSTLFLPNPRLLRSLGLYTGAMSVSFSVAISLPVIATTMWSMDTELRPASQPLRPLFDGLVCGVGAGLMWLLVYIQIARRYEPRYESTIKLGLGSYFLLLYLFSALLGYAFIYDPTYTYKPKWVDVLG